MAPITNSNEEEPSQQREVDPLDALWAGFRLPVPLAAKAKGERPADERDGPSSSAQNDEWMLRALDLRRLLHTMGEQYANPKARNHLFLTATTSRERRMEGQISLAFSSLAKLERTFPDVHETQVSYQNCHGILQKLKRDTEETCDKFRGWLDRHRQQRQGMPRERDLIYDIFLAPDTAEDEGCDGEGMLDEFSDDGEEDGTEDGADGGDGNAHAPTSVQRQPSQPVRPREEVDPVEFQKRQQEALEEELASMAERLKSSTLAMNATLQTQTKDLGEMEELAQTNLDTVAATTKKVEDRLTKKRGWRKTLVTWSLIATVLGTWVLCFMVMRTVPKRKVGKINVNVGRVREGAARLFHNAKQGGGLLWETLEETLENYFGEKQEEVGPSGMPVSWERGRARKEAEDRERRRKFGREAREEEERRRAERARREQQRPKHQQEQQQQQKREGGECEVLADGTQVCTGSKDEALAREIAAERRRRRIEERMANAPIVEAVEHVEEEGPNSVEEEEKRRTPIEGRGSDPMGCVPPTKGMSIHEEALEWLTKSLSTLEAMRDEVPENTERSAQLLQQLETIRGEHKNHASLLEVERNKARSAFWAERSIRVRARDLKRSLGSVEFCEGGAKGEGGEKRERLERERRFTERRKKEEEEARRLAENQDKIKTERAEQERLAAEAAKQAELDRLEKERNTAEERKKDEEAARRLAEKQARLDAEQLERERLAAEVAKQADLERLETERIFAEQRKKEDEEARRLAEKQAKLEAERLERDRLAAEAAKEAKLKMVERERTERERIIAERRKIEEEARRLAEEEARLEIERLIQERLAAERAKAEAKLRQTSVARSNAAAEAQHATERSKEIASAVDPDFLPSDVRSAAGRAENDRLAYYLVAQPETADAPDRSGWRPLHEAARAGNLGGVQLLVEAGCDLASRTGRTGKGGTALWWAIQRFGEDHDVVRLLQSHGAREDGPV